MRESYCLLLAVLLVVVSLCVYLVTRSSPDDRPAPTLLRAVVAFRHGSRTPRHTFANDLYSKDNATLWPEGSQGLSKIGKMEAYKLGERLRERYGAFLGDYYEPEETRAFSSPTERTLMSGELVLASLFPPAGLQIWNQELNWQPVPLYPDNIFTSSNVSSCPRFVVDAAESLAEMFATLSPEENEIVSFVMKHAGEPNGEPYDVIVRVWDAVFFQERANLPIPEWLKDVYPEKLSRIYNKIATALLFGSETQRKLFLDFPAQAIRDFLLAEDGRKMEIHSSHDTRISAMLRILGIEIEASPEPSSCLILEIHHYKGQKFIEVYYFDNCNSSQPRQLEMPCGLTCSAADLEEMVSHLKLDNYTEVCQSGKDKLEHNNKYESFVNIVCIEFGICLNDLPEYFS